MKYRELKVGKYYSTTYQKQGTYIFQQGANDYINLQRKYYRKVDADFTLANGFTNFREATFDEKLKLISSRVLRKYIENWYVLGSQELESNFLKFEEILNITIPLIGGGTYQGYSLSEEAAPSYWVYKEKMGLAITVEEASQIYLQFMNDKQKRKIVGYKTPKDLFGGSIVAGTEYRKLRDINKWYAPYTDRTKDIFNGSNSSSAADLGQTIPAELVEEWEAVYEDDTFEIGSWVYIKDTGFLCGPDTFSHNGQIKLIEEVNLNEGSDLFSVKFADGSYGRGSTLLPNFNIDHYLRLATEDEIREYNNVVIAGYPAEFGAGYVKFGCTQISKSDIEALLRLCNYNTINITLKVDAKSPELGEVVDFPTIQRIYSLIK